MKNQKSFSSIVILLFILLFGFAEYKFTEEVIATSLNLKTTKLATIPDIWSEKIEEIVFSPNGRQVVYIAREGETEETDRSFVVINGQRRKYSAVGNVFFSPDSEKLAYTACYGRCFVVLNGQEQKNMMT